MFAENTFITYAANEFAFLNYVARFFPFLAGVFAGITFDFWKDKVMSSSLREKFSSFLSINLLFVGAALFFMARMLAFAVASHQAFGIP